MLKNHGKEPGKNNLMLKNMEKNEKNDETWQFAIMAQWFLAEEMGDTLLSNRKKNLISPEKLKPIGIESKMMRSPRNCCEAPARRNVSTGKTWGWTVVRDKSLSSGPESKHMTVYTDFYWHFIRRWETGENFR